MEGFSDSDKEIRKENRRHFNKTVRALFKKSFLIKIRRPMSIVEFCIATVLWIVLYPCYKIACKNVASNQYPELTYNETIPSPLCYFFTTYANASYVIAPDCNNTRILTDLFNYSMMASLAVMGSRIINGTSNATLLSSDKNAILYDIQNQLKPEINNFIDKYSANIIQKVANSFQNIEADNLENTEFQDYIKLSIIEGIFTYHHSNQNEFNFDSFIKNNIFNYFNSIITLPNLYKVKQDADAKLENSYISDYINKYESKINSIIKNKFNYKSDMITLLQKSKKNKKVQNPHMPNVNWVLFNDVFPGDEFNSSNIDDNTTQALLNEYYRFDPLFVDSVDEIKNQIYLRTSNGFGIYWPNANDTNGTIKPFLQTYYQCVDEYPGEQLFNILIREVSYMNGEIGYPFDFSYIESQSYPYPKGKSYFDISILVAIIVVFPIIIASMCDLQILLEEKDNHVMILSFLMGCSETAYFLVIICMQFLSSIFAYVLMCIFYCFVFIFKGTSFTLMLVISILFILSHIAFVMFLTTFMKRAANGRALTVIFFVFTIFFAFVHFFYTLDESNHSNVSKHIFSIIPLSCYEMAMMSMFKESRAFMKPVGWDMLKNNSEVNLVYQMWFALMWLSIDLVFYFLLFLLFNLTNPRDFGSPPIKWKEIFKRRAWKTLFSRKKIMKLNKQATGVMYDTNTNLFDNELIKVENLSKTYHGHRTVTAISNVNFTIFQNEVIVVIGPNGAGKSTLINILSGALQPTTGTLSLYKEKPTESFNEIKNILGVCFQDNVIIEMLSIRENLNLFAAFRDITKDEMDKSMSFYSETLQLKDMMDTRTGDLSGGQKRKVCIWMSLLGNPPLVIMDEPTAGVDVQARQLIWKVIASLKNTTTVVTSHALEEAEAVSSRLFVVAGGTLPFAGTATEFRNTFKCGYILRIESQKASNEDDYQPKETSNNDFIIKEDGTASKNNNNNDNNNNDENEDEGMINLDVKEVELEDIKEMQQKLDSNDNNNNYNMKENDKKKRMSSRVVIVMDKDEMNSIPHRKKKFRKRKKKKSESLNKLIESVYCDSEDDSTDNEGSITEDEKAALRVLEFIRSYEPKAKMSSERVDSIRLPVSRNVPMIINQIEAHKDELGVKSYSISVEQLEDILLKMIMTEESSFNRSSVYE